jgi:DUF4097 and DUF4098 domain-containing protein YvlB
MKGRSIVIILVSLLLAGTLALCGVVGFGTYTFMQNNQMNIRIGGNLNAIGSSNDTRTYSADAVERLDVDTSNGNIQLLAGEGDEVVVEILRQAWGENQETAQAAAEALPVKVNLSGGTLTLKFYDEGPQELVIGSYQPAQVDYVIHVPQEVAAKLTNQAGDVLVDGVSGAVDIKNLFGDVTVNSLEGALTVDGNSSSISVEDVQAGDGDITIQTNFGKVDLNTLSGRTIRVNNESGDITARDLKASGDLTLDLSFGSLNGDGLEARNLTANNRSGQISLEGGQVEGTLEASTEFGNLTVRKMAASELVLTTQSANLTVEQVSGKLTLTNAFGDVTVTEAEQATVKINNENGAVNFSGTLDERNDQSIESTFGHISLSIPADSAFQVEWSTEFGKIASELPVTMQNNLSDTSWQGSLNDGDATLKIINQNGDIKINRLGSAQ